LVPGQENRLYALRAVVLAFAVAAAIPAAAADGTTVSAGFDYSTGKYGGAESTDILYLPLVIRRESGPLILKLTVPEVQVRRPVVVPGAILVSQGDEGVPVSSTSGTTQTETVSGLGDTVAAASYNVYFDSATGWLIDVTAKAKFATGDQNKGLSTGKNDYALQADLYKNLGAASLIGGVGYKWMGKPAGSNYRNVAYASAGVACKVADDATAGFIADYRGSVVPDTPSQRELTLYFARHLDRNWRLQGYLVAGMSDSSPQVGVGAMIGYAF
jgi:hypothetical protein